MRDTSSNNKALTKVAKTTALSGTVDNLVEKMLLDVSLKELIEWHESAQNVKT